MSTEGKRIEWVCRIAFAAVFLLNVSCAIGFVAFPEGYASSYELSGESGLAAVRGIGVAFLMWNATYPLFIASPRRHIPLGFIIIAQQLIGCVGEALIATTLSDGHEELLASISRFLEFDVGGLALMLATLMLLVISKKRILRDGQDLQGHQG